MADNLTKWDESSKSKSAFSESSKEKSDFRGGNNESDTVVLENVPFSSEDVDFDDNDCYFSGSKITRDYTIGKEKTGWEE